MLNAAWTLLISVRSPPRQTFSKLGVLHSAVNFEKVMTENLTEQHIEDKAWSEWWKVNYVLQLCREKKNPYLEEELLTDKQKEQEV